ncbi:hypothetical protein M409DRAFT_54792 [Zasmidium cellare ATCC 36951]|uniref:Adenosine deaminase domain-containing protein n=1 Tax=Zasmidium cellare ATCC 36951 TaxID=1080233 RepID=A0A6A6CGX6_ZASCE|nr:uncharacterized protein M409DRAFT_54792 [Zasmidium cellare ATCC 36951]KAF2166444.1 hypothetical protein M409DRAFT_54792 [Zasmidium cellare ATCC 36951]
MWGDVTENFTKALPKAELHAHLTGSISPECLHEVWKRKRSSPAGSQLEDPLSACRPEAEHHDILSFFPVFDKYIYNLCNDTESVAFATEQVLKEFEADGVKYLELRTTPRESLENGMTKEVYVQTVLDTIAKHGKEVLSTYLILSIDRRNTLEQAMETVRLAIKYQDKGVVGIDLCGNPLKGDVTTFREAFKLAKAHNLRLTLHFAEVPQSSTEVELQTLLSYQPDRLGHVIHTTPAIEAEISSRKLGLELCLSCNVHAKMLPGGKREFTDHHFANWYGQSNAIALCTDDVGIFGSPISNEYFLAAWHFNLSRYDLVELCRGAVESIFGGEREKQRLYSLLDEFEKICDNAEAAP